VRIRHKIEKAKKIKETVYSQPPSSFYASTGTDGFGAQTAYSTSGLRHCSQGTQKSVSLAEFERATAAQHPDQTSQADT